MSVNQNTMWAGKWLEILEKVFFLSELYSESLSSIIYANATANHIWNEKQLQTRERGDTNTFDIRMTTVDAL